MKGGLTIPITASAELLVSRIRVKGFRCLRDVEIVLEPDTTILVGENNSGKSSLLLAIATSLGRRRPTADDLHQDASGARASEAIIDVFLVPPAGAQAFADATRQRLISVQREPSTNRETVGIRTTLRRSSEGSFLSDIRNFLQPSNEEWISSPTPPFQSRVLDLIEAHLIDASRDLLDEMTTQTSSWGRVLSDLGIPESADSIADAASIDRATLETSLKELAGRVRSASPVLTQLQTDLERMTGLQPGIGRVDLRALPLRIEELGRTIEVVLMRHESAELPLRFQGLGSRSLAALLVFRTLCMLRVGADQGTKPHLLTLLEEPEAHLHPHAIGALNGLLSNLPGQRVVTTHSSTLVAEAAPSSIRLCRWRRSGIQVTRMPSGHPKRAEQFRRYFGRPFGEVFFARLVVLGDGVTEQNVLPILVSMALGADAGSRGISFVDCKSMSGTDDVNHILKAVHAIGLPWLCYVDNDAAGLTSLGKLRDPGTGQPLDEAHEAVVVLPAVTKQIEQILVDADYGHEIKQVALDNGTPVDEPKEQLSFLTNNKVWAPELVAIRAKQAGKPAPPQLQPLFSAIRRILDIGPQEVVVGELQ